MALTGSGGSSSRTLPGLLPRTAALTIAFGLVFAQFGQPASAGTGAHSAQAIASVEGDDSGPAAGVGTDIIDESDVSAAAVVDCQCVAFVQRYYGLTGQMRNATDMGGVLKQNGFKYVGHGMAPRKGDVAVWKDTYYPRFGHIAIVESVTWDSPGWIVKFRGANQGGSLFTQKNCRNVSIRANMGYTAADYYRR
ncbi:CHAP domain-containing protein [Microtetraspora malaysiensis]|uniref:CHAP domain-containing protein n=1 Tax=Microtetraspora malaysiensis TaxID=161358 RepID=A0ABW6T3W5_9ACTN